MHLISSSRADPVQTAYSSGAGLQPRPDLRLKHFLFFFEFSGESFWRRYATANRPAPKRFPQFSKNVSNSRLKASGACLHPRPDLVQNRGRLAAQTEAQFRTCRTFQRDRSLEADGRYYGPRAHRLTAEGCLPSRHRALQSAIRTRASTWGSTWRRASEGDVDRKVGGEEGCRRRWERVRWRNRIWEVGRGLGGL